MRKTSGFALIAAAAATFLACSSAPTDGGDKVDTANEGDAINFSANWTLIGSLDYGQTSGTFNYTRHPKYRAYKFGGSTGDQIDVKVHSTNGGDSVAWVLDNDFKVVGHNDDANGSLDSEIKVTLPANASITHYIVVRDYNYADARFNITLDGTPATPDWASCRVDSDCTAVPENACCHNGRMEAVNKDHVTDYEDSFTCPNPHPICPLYVMLDTRQPECNNDTHTCEMVAISDISCGGFVMNSHKCPDGYDCALPVGKPDIPGKCEAAGSTGKTCGGIAGITCPSGQTCVDNPSDGCDPSAGGADCSGECVDVSAATTCGGIAGRGCPMGQYCVDDPTDSCDPSKGGADCGGICVN